LLASKLDKSQVFNFKRQWFNYTSYVPHNGQDSLHFPNKNARFIVAICGRRWGKSVAASKEIEVMLNIPKTRSWVVAPTYQTAEKVFREVWHSIIQNRDPKKNIQTTRASYKDMYIETTTGSTFEAKSADNPNSLVGEGLDLLILDEAAKQKKIVWEMYLRPTLSDRKGRAIFITTPEGYNWVYDLYLKGQKDEEWLSFNSPSWQNQFAYPEGASDPDLKEAKRNLSVEVFDQEYGSKFTSFAGRVYPFDRDLDFGNFPYDPNFPTFCSIDFGYRMPAVAWFQTHMVEGHWHINVIDEIIHESNVKTDDLARRVKSKPYNVQAYFGDPAGKSVQGQSGLGDMEIFRKFGMSIRCVRDKVSTNIASGISHVRSFVENADGERFIHLDHKCKGLSEDFENYRYPEHKEGTNLKPDPLKDGIHDHGMDMVRYFFINRFPIRNNKLRLEPR
tara:strand:- start:4961 stop:6301 length:1341 start_codon:yes stop_codon:yes gene_type:complete